MADLTNPRVIKLKGLLFLFLGLLSSAIVLVEIRSLRLTVLFVIAVWSFCRFYYCAFYVIEHYVDPRFRFAGLWAFFKYLIATRDHAASQPRNGADMNSPGRAKRGHGND